MTMLDRRTFFKRSSLAVGAVAAATALQTGWPTLAGVSPQGKRLSLAFRIAPRRWQSQFQELLHLLTTHHDAVDEVALFDTEYPTASLEHMAEVADQMGRRMTELRAAGFRPGINVLWTLGHWNVAEAPKMPFRPMTGHDGQQANACPCPNDGAYRDYVMQRYRLMARQKPAFLWVDDDFRNLSHGVAYPCFCTECLKQFGRGDREPLVQSLNAPENTDLRLAWTEFCGSSLESLAADIGKAIAETDPAIEVGLMTFGYSFSTYGGYPLRRWMNALGAVRGRPGHGFYADAEPRTILHKALDVGRQIRDYPSRIHTIQYEAENYPYILLDKSPRTLLNESLLAVAMGCTGVAFNILGQWEGNLRDYTPYLQTIASARPLLEKTVTALEGLSLAGFWPADHPLLMARRSVGPEGWFTEGGLYDIQLPNQLAEMGVPLTVDRKTACGVVLAGRVAEGFSDDELRSILSGGVLLDHNALAVLWQRGLGPLTGVKLGKKTTKAIYERLADHPLNGDDAGNLRDALIFAGTDSLVPVAEDVASLATMVDEDGADFGCSLSTFTNSLNGRVAVSTYSPWTRLGMADKRRQLLALTDWLAGGRLPIIIEQTVRVAPFVRQSADLRRAAVVLLNLSFDPTGPLTLRLRTQAKNAVLVTADSPQPLAVRPSEGELRIEMPSIDPWHVAVLAAG